MRVPAINQQGWLDGECARVDWTAVMEEEQGYGYTYTISLHYTDYHLYASLSLCVCLVHTLL